jgi:Ni2+-binding GTPase involved in maturation of urease and hydrogenase
MEHIIYIAISVISPLIVFLTAYFLIKQMLRKDIEKSRINQLAQSKKEIIQLRLQAYERFILLLERIKAGNMLMRTDTHQKSADQLHIELLSILRGEFDHNLSQQLYVSEEAWQLTKIAKEDTIKVINLAREQAGNEAKGIDFAKKILEMEQKHPGSLQNAVSFIKKEAQNMF